MKRVPSVSPKPTDELRDDDAIDAVLDVGMITTHVQLAEGILGHTRRLQDQILQRRVIPFWERRDGLGIEVIAAGAGLHIDHGACPVETLPLDLDAT